MTVHEIFEKRKSTPHNIDQHLDTLERLAEECQSVVELGTEHGWSTSAFLAAQVWTLDCFDLFRQPEVDLLEAAARDSETSFTFHLRDSLACEIPECDLLFIDTDHTYNQVKGELMRHGNKARKYLVFHDTETFPAIVPAIREFVEANPHWRLKEHYRHQHGLTVYERSEG